MRFMQTESVLQTKNRSGPAKKSVFCSPGQHIVTDISDIARAGVSAVRKTILNPKTEKIAFFNFITVRNIVFVACYE